MPNAARKRTRPRKAAATTTPAAAATPHEPPALVATALQEKFTRLVFDGRYRYIGIGGAIRGSKTWSVLIALVLLMRIYPRSRWAIVREDWTALTQNTMPSIETLRATLGGWLGPINLRTKTYRAQNGSELLLVPESLPTDPDLNAFKGFEVNGFVLEEGNELSVKTFHKAIERAGAWIIQPTADERASGITPAQPPPRVLVSFNPSLEWTDEVFHEPYESGTLREPYAFLPAKITDNPHLPPTYLESLEELRNAAPDEYERFVMGKRGGTPDPRQLITMDMIVRARDVTHEPGRIRMGLDVMRGGKDENVLAIIDGNMLVDLIPIVVPDDSTTDLAIAAMEHAHEWEALPDDVRVDTIGVGGGAYDTMKDRRFEPRAFVAGASPIVRPKDHPFARWEYQNLRAQAWWEFREKLRRGMFGLDPELATRRPDEWKKFVKDITAFRYDFVRERKIDVSSRDEVQASIGRSPDYGTAAVMAAIDLPPRVAKGPVGRYASTSRLTI